eukprot:TRINITY_DN15127_c0_g1_i1.p1 TRINITY_DN15127_c0_g1~~TRINITY_DN15127_c0_g1_i1.p1  ORF type:complete len:284 (+),score=11.56 TRINITY_DN15127_c0_g1_i1:61-912(+)
MSSKISLYLTMVFSSISIFIIENPVYQHSKIYDSFNKPSRDYPYYDSWKKFHLLQMLFLVMFSLIRYTFVKNKYNEGNRHLQLCLLIGIISSFIGDVINSEIINLSFIIKPQVLLSAIPFSITHICYAYVISMICFSKSENQRKIEIIDLLKKIHRLCLLLVPVIAISLWYYYVYSNSNSATSSLLLFISFGYSFLVTILFIATLLLFLCSYVIEKNSIYFDFILFLGGSLFLYSDCMISVSLFSGIYTSISHLQLIWVTYYASQIILCPFLLLCYFTSSATE